MTGGDVDDVRKTATVGGVILALAGAGLSIALYLDHLTSGAVGCGGGGCSEVTTTKYGYVFGIPTPLLLIPYYVLHGALHAQFAVTDDDRRGHAQWGAALLAVAGALTTLWLAGVSYFALHDWCKLCVALYFVNAMFLVGDLFVLWVERDTMTTRPDWPLSRFTIMVPAVIFLLSAAIFARCHRAGVHRGAKIVAAERGFAIATGGARRVAITLDPGCGDCAKKWPWIRRALRTLQAEGKPLDVTVDLFPGEGSCLVAIGMPGADRLPLRPERKGTCRATAHAFCAALQNALTEYLDYHYAQLRKIEVQGFERAGVKAYRALHQHARLDAAAMERCTGDGGQTWTLDNMTEVPRQALRAHVLRQSNKLPWFLERNIGLPMITVNDVFIDHETVTTEQEMLDAIRGAL